MMTGNGSCNCSFTNALITKHQSWYIAAAVVAAVSCLLGIPANITIILQLSRHLRGSSMSQRLFFNLAMSDLLCLICVSFGVFIFFSKTCLTHGVCKFLVYFIFFCFISDLNIVVLISIQRYYQVLHPEKWAMVNRTWQRILLFSVWMLAAVLAFPVVFHTNQPNDHSCNTQGIKLELEAFYIPFIAFSYLVLFTFYLLLVKGVKKAQMSDKKPPKATKILIRIITVYLVASFFPLILRLFYVIVCFTNRNLLIVSQLLTFVECFYFYNHCLNPFLYFFASRHSREKRKCILNDT